MSIPIFEFAEPTDRQLEEALHSLADRKFASSCVDRGLKELTSGNLRLWVPRFTLLAAQQAGRVDEVLGYYDSFLAYCDTTTHVDWYPSFIKTVPTDNLLSLSGRLGDDLEEFSAELSRVVAILGADKKGAILDLGCGGAYLQSILPSRDTRKSPAPT